MLELSSEFARAITVQFESNLAAHPRKRQELRAYFENCDPEHLLCLQFLYGAMQVCDIVSFSPAQIDSYVTASLAALSQLDYTRSIPADLFLNYVLTPRVNNEYLDFSRAELFQTLLPRVQGKTMEQAALEVNYWCYEYVTYIPSDDRTLAPLATMRSGLGRCGEESTFTVSALRAVGIPARQCYVPRWSHCDDNHAWVELWADGQWHYLGACEPESVLDRGWFTAAASRAMLTHARAWSRFVPDGDAAVRTPLYTLLNSTDTYADCKDLTVFVTEDGSPVEAVPVQFQLVNFSECCTIYQASTDHTGIVTFRTGQGGLLVHVFHRGRLLLRPVDVRQETYIHLELTEGRSPAQYSGQARTFDLVPPAERVQTSCAPAQTSAHRERLARCEDLRGTRTTAFALPDDTPFSQYRICAKRNLSELDHFLSDPHFSKTEKLELLSTLRSKDFIDCTAEMLSDTLLTARAHRERFPAELYRDYILAPRVSNEMLLPVRSALKAQAPAYLTTGKDVLAWLQSQVTILSGHGVTGMFADSARALEQGQISEDSFGVLFVNLCRALGIPARQNPSTLEYEWLEDDRFYSITPQKAGERTVDLTLKNETGSLILYGQQFSVARFMDDRYQTLQFEGLAAGKNTTLQVPPGNYLLLTTTRQIDGTVSAFARYQTVRKATTLPLQLPEDQTARRLKDIALSPFLPDGPIRTLLESTSGPWLLLLLEPGKEPTEHLLQELLACAADYNGAAYPLYLLVAPDADLQNVTLHRVLQALPGAKLLTIEDEAAFDGLHRMMGVGDQRLPFSLAIDKGGRGLYAFANYNIGTAQTLFKILQLSEERSPFHG